MVLDMGFFHICFLFSMHSVTNRFLFDDSREKSDCIVYTVICRMYDLSEY